MEVFLYGYSTKQFVVICMNNEPLNQYEIKIAFGI